MGADEGFVAGMETTMLLTTIMKIGEYHTYIHKYLLYIHTNPLFFFTFFMPTYIHTAVDEAYPL